MWNRDRILALVIVVLGAFIASYSLVVLDFGSIHNPDSGFLTFFVGLAFVVLGVAWAFNTKAHREPTGDFIAPQKWIKPVEALIILIFYAVAFKWLGYITSTIIFMVAWQQLIERQNWLNTMLISVLSTAGMYLLFGLLLKAPLPQEIFLR